MPDKETQPPRDWRAQDPEKKKDDDGRNDHGLGWRPPTTKERDSDGDPEDAGSQGDDSQFE